MGMKAGSQARRSPKMGKKEKSAPPSEEKKTDRSGAKAAASAQATEVDQSLTRHRLHFCVFFQKRRRGQGRRERLVATDERRKGEDVFVLWREVTHEVVNARTYQKTPK